MVLAPHVSANEEASKTLRLCTELAARRISILAGTDTQTHRGQNLQAPPPLTQGICIPCAGYAPPHSNIRSTILHILCSVVSFHIILFYDF